MWGEVTDQNSFKVYFVNYLGRWQNPEIMKNVDIEADSANLWNSIDVNKNGKLDKDEELLVMAQLMRHSIEKTKKFFGIE